MRHKTGGDGAATATRRGYRIESGKSRTGLHTVGPNRSRGRRNVESGTTRWSCWPCPRSSPGWDHVGASLVGARGGVVWMNAGTTLAAVGYANQLRRGRLVVAGARVPRTNGRPHPNAPTKGHGVAGYFRTRASSQLNLTPDRRLSPDSIRSTTSLHIFTFV